MPPYTPRTTEGDEAGASVETQPIRFPFPDRTSEDLVWHHTDADGFLNILKTNELWLSNPRALNDSTEFLFGYEQVKRIWETNELKDGVSPGIVNFVDEVLSDDLFNSQRDLVFILSATKKIDSLNQWMHYGKSDGFAIGLDTHISYAPKGSPSLGAGRQSSEQLFFSNWYDAVYEPVEVHRIAEEVLQFVIDDAPRLFDGNSREASIYLARMIISSQAVRIKHVGFADEREVRFVTGKPVETPHEFRTIRGSVIPYIEVVALDPDLSRGFLAAERLPIRKVMAGPSIDPRDVKWLKALLEKRGYSDVEILSSKVPYSG